MQVKRLLKFLLVTSVFVGILVAGLYLAFNVYKPQLIEIIPKKISEKLHVPVSLSDLDLTFKPIPSIVINDLKVGHQEMALATKVIIPKVVVGLDFSALSSGRLDVALSLTRPDLHYETRSSAETKAEANGKTITIPTGFSSPYGLSLGLHLHIEDAQVHLVHRDQAEKVLWKADVGHFGCDVEGSSLTRPVNFTFQGDASWEPYIPVTVPWRIQGHTEMVGQSLDFRSIAITLASLTTNADGSYDLTDKKWWANIKTNTADLGKIPGLQAFMGKLDVNAEAQGMGDQFAARGSVDAENIEGPIDLKKGDNSALGKFKLHTQLHFVWNKTWVVNPISFQTDLSSVAIRAGNVFVKPSGLPFTIQLDGGVDQNQLVIQRAHVTLASLMADLNGDFQMGANYGSQFTIVIPPSPLAGMEKFMPFLSTNPLQGMIELRAQVVGSLKSPQTLRINASPIKLDRVRGRLDWKSSDKKENLEGPVNLDGLVNLNLVGKQIVAAFAHLTADLTGVQAHTSQLDKRAGVPFRVTFDAKKMKDKISIQQSQIDLGSARAAMRGWLKPTSTGPQFDIGWGVSKLDLQNMSQMFPRLKPLGLSGWAIGQGRMTGNYMAARGFASSPWMMKALLKTHMDQLRGLPASQAEPESFSLKKAEQKTQTTDMNAWLKHFKVTWQGDIADLVLAKDVAAHGVVWKLNLNRQFLDGSAKIEHMLSGSARIYLHSINLAGGLWPVALQLDHLEIAPLIDQWAHSWKGLARGKLSGHVDAEIPSAMRHQQPPSLLTNMKAQGRLRLDDGYLSTLQFDKALNQKIARIPGLGRQDMIQTGGTSMDVETNLNLNQGRVQFSNFYVWTPDRDELRANGWLQLTDKTLDMQGDVWLAHPPIQGDLLAANQDGSGRLEIPVRISGVATNPNFHLTDETLMKMTKKLIRHQGQRLIKNTIDQILNRAGGGN